MTAILPHITHETGNNPQYSIIWLHGLGADGHDFVPVVDNLQLPVSVRYIFPHAPHRPVTLNGGYEMRAWFDIFTPFDPDTMRGENQSAREDIIGIRTSQTQIDALINQEIARGITPQHIFLVGFSQGGAIALHTALRQRMPLAGLLALSGYLPLVNSITSAFTPASKLSAFFMAHGRQDPVVPYELGLAAKTRLNKLGYPIEWHEYDMQHTVNDMELRDIESWLSHRIQAIGMKDDE
ncbi:MAG: carboxylesterase [Gallionella sp.]